MAAIQASVVLRTLLWFSLISLLAVSSASLAQESDLAVTKTGPAQSAADTDVAYTVTVFNGGPDPAITVTLTDPIPPGMTFVSKDVTGAPGFGCTDPGVGSGGQVVCTGGTIASGGSAVFVFVFHIPAGTADGTFFTNIATSTSPTDPFDENDSGTATTNTPFPPQSDLFVLKSGPSSAGPDADVVYTITVGNNGPDAPATLHFSDTLPGAMTFMSLVQNSGPALNCTPVPVGSGGTITCGAASYPAGASSILTLTGHIPAGTPSGTTFTNTGTVSTKEDDPNPDNNSSETTLTVSATDVFVVKTGPTTAQAGNITYSITVTNGGPDVANTVQFYDPLPGGTTFVSFAQDGGATASCTQPEVGNNGTVVCNWLSLANGAVGQFTLVIFSGANTSITNTAFVTTQSFDTDPGNDQDSVTTSVTQVADLSIVKNGPATASAGSNISYDVTVTNAGPSNATTVSVTDTLEPGLTFVSASGPAGWSCTPASGTITCNTATLLAGTTAPLTFVVHLTSSAAAGSMISNTAEVSAATSDPDSGDLSSTTTATVTPALPTDVSITKTTEDEDFVAGGTVPYTIVVRNNGTSDALGTEVTDTIPAGTTLQSATSTQGTCSGTPTVTCTIGTLAPGASATITLVVALPSTPGTFTNTANVTISNGDPNPLNNASTAAITSSAIAAIPTLSPLALALLGAAFALTGLIALRGRL
jgi:uncharacterized repeat protein (TIGR01451 family)